MKTYVSCLFVLICCSLASLNVDAKYDRKTDAELIDNEIPCGVANAKETFVDRIVGGEKAQPHEFPWLVSIKVLFGREFKHNCGGSIIHPEFILTAAQCVDVSKDKIKITAGAVNITKKNSEEQDRNVKKIFTGLYNDENYQNDIALLQMDKQLDYKQESVAPICLPRGDEIYHDSVIVAGWGKLKENGKVADELMKIVLTIYETKACQDIYSEHGYDYFMHKCQMCAKGENKDICDGDSGGPLMCSNKKDNNIYACGLGSIGVGCNGGIYPALFTNVTCFTSWITKTIDDNKSK